MAGVTDLSKTTPAKPSLSAFPKLWTLWYFAGTSGPQFKNFIFDGTMREAMQRGREHCSRMNYRFGSVRPFILDLDYQEQRYFETNQEFPAEEEEKK
jgi:hypothetical protein